MISSALIENLPWRNRNRGGLVTDENARVLKEDGTIIPGLHAVGNTPASVMGNSYPGPGGTIGPAMTFAFLAIQDMLDKSV